MKHSIACLAVLLVASVTNVAVAADTINPIPACSSASSDADGDGWGWENNASCIVVATDIAVAQAVCVDSDGDGYGWDGTDTCFINPAAIVESACIDSDGDGYGWDGTDTCIPGAGTVDSEPEPVVTTPVCVDTGVIGDTWGWDGTESCRIPPSLTGGDTSAIAGIWDTSSTDEPDSESYFIITADGITGYIDSDTNYTDGSKCYWISEPVNTETEINVVYPLGNNLYRFDYYENFYSDIYFESFEVEMEVNENNELVIYSVDGLPEELVFPASTINPDNLTLCSSDF